MVTGGDTGSCLVEEHENNHIMVATMCCQSSKKSNTILGDVYTENNFNLTSEPSTGMTAATVSLMCTVQD